jgi:hypothetical protein
MISPADFRLNLVLKNKIFSVLMPYGSVEFNPVSFKNFGGLLPKYTVSQTRKCYLSYWQLWKSQILICYWKSALQFEERVQFLPVSVEYSGATYI